MDLPVTQLWDSRLLYIYALLGGFIDSDKEEISKRILLLARQKDNSRYCLRILRKLESERKIQISNIEIDFSKVDERPIRITDENRADVLAWQATSEKIEESGTQDMRSVRSLSQMMSLLHANSDTRFKFNISTADVEWFKSRTLSYLKIFQENNIFTPDGDDLMHWEQQRKVALKKIDILDTHNEVLVVQTNTLRFLECLLILSNDKLVKILSLKPVKLGSINTLDMLKAKVLKKEKLTSEPGLNGKSTNEEKRSYKVDVSLIGVRINLNVEGEEPILLKKVRTDAVNHNFMKYIIHRAGQQLGLGKIQEEVAGAKSKKDLTEVVRRCGFSDELKDYFFEGTSAQKVYFNPQAILSGSELVALKEHLANRKKSPKIAQK